jgi:hypothetical protein
VCDDDDEEGHGDGVVVRVVAGARAVLVIVLVLMQVLQVLLCGWCRCFRCRVHPTARPPYLPVAHGQRVPVHEVATRCIDGMGLVPFGLVEQSKEQMNHPQSQH